MYILESWVASASRFSQPRSRTFNVMHATGNQKENEGIASLWRILRGSFKGSAQSSRHTNMIYIKLEVDILLSPGGGDRWEVGVGGTQRGRMGPFPLIQVTRWELENHSGITRSPHQPQCSLEVITRCSPGELRSSFGFSKYKNLFEACYMELSHLDFHNCRCNLTPLKPITSQSRKKYPGHHALDDRFD